MIISTRKVEAKCPYCGLLNNFNIEVEGNQPRVVRCHNPLPYWSLREGETPCKRMFVVDVEWVAMMSIKKIEGGGN
jgi:hypothetical protein